MRRWTGIAAQIRRESGLFSERLQTPRRATSSRRLRAFASGFLEDGRQDESPDRALVSTQPLWPDLRILNCQTPGLESQLSRDILRPARIEAESAYGKS